MATVVGTDGQYLFYNDDSGVLQKTALSAAPPSLPFNSVFAKDYGVTADGQFVYDAVSVNQSNIITSASANFTSSDVGKIVFGIDNTGTPTSPPQGVIESVVDAHTITVSVAASATKSSVALGWGTDDTDACINAWATALAQEQYLILPAGFIFLQKSTFTASTGSIPVKNIGLLSDGFSTLCPTPNFDFSSAPTSTSGIFFYTAGRGLLNTMPNYSVISNIGVFGAGQKFTNATNANAWLWLQQTMAFNVWVWNIGTGSNVTGIFCEGPVNAWNLVSFITGSVGIACSGGQSINFYGCYSGSATVNLAVAGSTQLNSFGSQWGQSTGNPSIRIAAGGVFNSYGEQFLGGGAGGANARTFDVAGILNLIGAQIISDANQYGINIESGGRVYVSQSQFNLSGISPAGTVALIDPAGVYVDDGTNTILAGTPPSILAADITLDTNWGTSGSAGDGVSSVTGDIQRFQFTITAAGTPGANPTVVINFPWTQARTPLFIAKQVGGSGAIQFLTGENTASTTTMTLTWNGTPVANKTYIFQCISE